MWNSKTVFKLHSIRSKHIEICVHFNRTRVMWMKQWLVISNLWIRQIIIGYTLTTKNRPANRQIYSTYTFFLYQCDILSTSTETANERLLCSYSYLITNQLNGGRSSHPKLGFRPGGDEMRTPNTITTTQITARLFTFTCLLYSHPHLNASHHCTLG